MGVIPYPEFIGGYSTSRTINLDCQDLVNWYVEYASSRGAKVPKGLMPTPGYASYCTLGASAGAVKAQFYQNDRHFAVSGGVLWEIDSSGVETNRGVVAVDGDPASICASPTQLLIISAGQGYIFTLATNTLTLITSAYFPVNAVMGEYILGRFVAIGSGSVSFYNSSLNDGLTWSVNPNTKSSTSDNLLAIKQVNNDLWLIGELNTEIWYVTGDATVIYAQRQGAQPKIGSNAPFSVVPLDNGLFLQGSDENGFGVVLRSSGYGYIKISPPELDTVLQGYPGLANTIGSAVQINGHAQFQLYFPDANVTWRFDIATNQWYKAMYWNAVLGQFEAYKGMNHVAAFGKHIIGSRETGVLYELSDSYYTDAGDTIRRLRRAPHLSNMQEETFYNSIQIDVQPGVGLATGQGSNPIIMLRYSIDGGHNWSDVLELTAGQIGETKWEAKVWRLGSSKDMVFEITTTDPVPWYILQALLDVYPGLP